ncbi:MAG: long-chain fatty acid--CoA ligase [Rickettsiales bacterium]|nr:long-chain fatty acid--CoA ligase [Rickettsiales bacterium]
MVTNFSEAETLVDLFKFIAKNHKSDFCLNYLNNDHWKHISTKDFIKKTLALAQYLKSIGVTNNSKVAIFAKSSPYWLIYDFAILLNGAISVPMFTNISPLNLSFQIKDSGVKFAFVDGSENWQEIKKYIKNFDEIIVHSIKVKSPKVTYLSHIIENAENSVSINCFKKQINTNDIATIIYTSGSTGNPKGVCLTHGNLVSQVQSSSKLFDLSNTDTALSFLPLAHIFERMVMLLYLTQNVKVYFADDVLNVQKLLAEVKPTVITTVPRLLEKIFFGVKEKIASASFVKRSIAKIAFKYALKASTDWSNKNFIWSLSNKILYKKIIDNLGGNIKIMITGGAPLTADIYKFFINIGLPLYQGYGLTETSPVISVNYPNAVKFGSSGKVLPSVKVKINTDGEILVKGPNVMHSYYKNIKETENAIKDDWLYTGDLGRIDSDGYLFINGRKKELMKTSNGKYVSPVNIEAMLKNIDHVENAMIVADGYKFVSAIIFPNKAGLKSNKIKLKKFYKYVSDEIDQINKNLNNWEQVKKFIIAKDNPSISNNQLTPSMKIRRHIILDHYKKSILALYK